MITRLEALVVLPIRTAYEPVGDAPKMSWRKWWTPLPLGHGAEAAILNPVSSTGQALVGLCTAALLVWRFTRRIRRWTRP